MYNANFGEEQHGFRKEIEEQRMCCLHRDIVVRVARRINARDQVVLSHRPAGGIQNNVERNGDGDIELASHSTVLAMLPQRIDIVALLLSLDIGLAHQARTFEHQNTTINADIARISEYSKLWRQQPSVV